jgi:hypothetical protein
VNDGQALSHSGVTEMFKRFKDGRENLQDDFCSGHPSASRNAQPIADLCETVMRDRQWALRMMMD